MMHQKQHILMVDDNEDDLFLMRNAFKKAEFNIPLHEVHNGEEAIAYLRGDAPYGDRKQFPLPTLMLLDLNMPRKNGFEVLTWIRAQTGLKRLSIFVLSTSIRTEDVQQAFDCGANSFLVKPSNIDSLVAMLRCMHEWIQINHFPSLDAVPY